MSRLPMPGTFTYIEMPDLTDAGIADAFVADILSVKNDMPRMLTWCPERRRWAFLIGGGAHFARWFATEEVEAIARAFLDRLYRRAVAAALQGYERRTGLRQAKRLRSAAMLSTVLRLAKADWRLHRSLDSLKTHKGEPAEVIAKEVA